MAAKVPHEATVLLVDDEREVLDSVRSFLEHIFPGIKVLVAESARDGLKLLASNPVDAVLADYKMPDQSGLDMLEVAARSKPNVPRILFTAYPDLEVAIRALNEARIRWFLLKPLEPEALGGVLAHILAESDLPPP